MKPFILSNMTWEEVKEALNTVKLAIIPIGAHEQHGPHLTENCDAVLAEEMAKKLAERLHPFTIVAPTVNFGVSHHHLHFPGTISLKPLTLIELLKDIVFSLKQSGITNYLFLNSHGGNQSTLDVACTTLTQELEVNIYYAKTTASAKKSLSEYIKSPLFGHSCEREVSEALYLAPHIVRHEKITRGQINLGGEWKNLRPGSAVQGFYFYEEMTSNGSIGDASKASIEIGEKIIEEALENISNTIKSLLELEIDAVYNN